MKKIIVLSIAIIATISTANGWNTRLNEGVMILAHKHLTPQAAAVIEQHLGTSFADDMLFIAKAQKNKRSNFSQEVHFLHLDSNLAPITTSENDAYVQITKALDIIANRRNHKKAEVTMALRHLIELMCDIHNLGNVRIESYPLSQREFTMNYSNGKKGKNEVITKLGWGRLWDIYTSRHPGFSAPFWAEDLEVCWGAKKSEFMSGNLNEWVKHIGTKTANILNGVSEGMPLSVKQRNLWEDDHYEMAGRAAYRLAALLNETIK